jgi:hypothetical protein
VANWQAEIEGVALSLLDSVFPKQYQKHSRKVRHGTRGKSTLDAANVFVACVAPWSARMVGHADQLKPRS